MALYNLKELHKLLNKVKNFPCRKSNLELYSPRIRKLLVVSKVLNNKLI